MLPVAFADAWQEYCCAEPLLPAKPPPVAPQRIAEVAEIAAAFDLIALDAWGVLTLGERAIATAVSAVAGLRAMGKRLLVVSNGGSRDPPAAASRLRRFGFDIAPGEIVSGLQILAEALAQLSPSPPVGLIADPPAPLASLTRTMLPLGDDAAAYDRVSAIVFLSSDGWTLSRQALLEASLERQPRPLFVANPDIVSPEPARLNAEPGFYAFRLARATGLRPICCGKPFPAIYDLIRRRHPEIAPARMLCVGDTLHTDILGGRAAGCRTLLIEDGFCRGADSEALAAECGIWPDFIAGRL